MNSPAWPEVTTHQDSCRNFQIVAFVPADGSNQHAMAIAAIQHRRYATTPPFEGTYLHGFGWFGFVWTEAKKGR